jgi:hypothetical protein
MPLNKTFMPKRNVLRLFKTKALATLLLMLALMAAERVSAQQVNIATGLPSSASSGSSSAPSVVTFCINNTRSSAVTLKRIDHYMSTSNASTVWKLFCSASSLSGQPNVTTWTLIDSVIGPTVTGTGIYTLFTTLSFSIPASTTYRFALQTTASIINYGGATVTPNSQSVVGIDLYRGNYTIGGSNVGYAGSASAPPFSPRFFCGTVYFDTAAQVCSGIPAAPTITTAPFPAATPFCSGSTTTITAVNPNVGSGLSLQWQRSSSAMGPWSNVTGGSGATTLSYTTGPITANTYFRIGVTCSNSNQTSYSAPYLITLGSPQPGTITGLSTYCTGTPETYSVPFVAGTTYAWTLPPGWAGFSTTNSITVTPGALSGPATISVTATSPCGPVSIARTRSIVPGSAPGPPGTIQGKSFVCSGSQQTYTVPAVGGAASYVWTLPPGWTGSSTSNTINATSNSNSGTITVKAINGCGQSSANTLPITVISALANPGAITGHDTVCSGDLHAYSIAPVPGATSYTWTLPSGWSGTTTGTSIQAFAGTAGGTLSVTAYVSCAVSPTSNKSISVVSTVNPSVTISAPSGTLCQGSPITITATPSFPGASPSYRWTKNGTPVIAFGNTYTTNTLAPGDSVSVTLTSTAGCASDTTAVSNTLKPLITPSIMPGVSINTVPPIVICKGTPVTFTAISTGTGASPVYQWFKNGTAITGANSTTYTDATLSDLDTLTIKMTTSASCAAMPSAGSNKVGVRVNDVVTPMVNIEVSPSDVVVPGQPLVFTATQSNGGATPDYQWLKNGVDIPFETGSSYTSSTLQGGDHISVKMISYEPCADQLQVTSNQIVLKGTLGVSTAGSAAGSLKLYPNPTGGRFTVAASWGAQYSGAQVRLDVLSVVGQLVHHVDLVPSGSAWQTQIELEPGLANGHYMLRVSTGDGSMSATLPFTLNR